VLAPDPQRHRPPERLQPEIDRELSADEFERLRAIPIGEDERAETMALIEWFCRRYPTPGERLAYARRATARWRRNRPPR
jgi:hypothetical protein